MWGSTASGERFAQKRRQLVSRALATVGLALLPRGGRAAPVVPADLVLRGGDTAQAVAVAGNRILAVGSDAEVMGLADGNTRVVDLKGATVIPGLRDSHLHTLGAARDIFNVALEDARSLDAVLQTLAGRVAVTPPGEWVIGSSGWHEGQIAEGRMPTRGTASRPTTPCSSRAAATWGSPTRPPSGWPGSRAIRRIQGAA